MGRLLQHFLDLSEPPAWRDLGKEIAGLAFTLLLPVVVACAWVACGGHP
jgi:hypothetical protein